MVLSLPRMGERPMMTEARADLTCWLASDTSSCEGEGRDSHGVSGEVTPNPTKPERSLFSPCHSGSGDSQAARGIISPPLKVPKYFKPKVAQSRGLGTQFATGYP